MRDRILKANDLKVEALEVPEWGGVIHIREMGGVELAAFQAGCATAKDGDFSKNLELLALAVALSVCDEAGALQFTVEDAVELRKRNMRVLDRVAQAALKLSGMDAKAQADAEKK